MYQYPYTLSKMKIQVNGITDGQSIIFSTDGGSKPVVETISKDGIYEIDWTKLNNLTPCIYTGFVGECNITIEQIPLYPGALVLDGTDDYIALDAFDSGFKTMFMVCNVFNTGSKTLYDQQSTDFDKNYAIAVNGSITAYAYSNINPTYINGVLNTTLTGSDLKNKKHLIHVLTNDINVSRIPNIGKSLGRNLYSDFALYKFLGFKDELTEEQIQAIIKKYNLLDGVDEIEVS